MSVFYDDPSGWQIEIDYDYRIGLIHFQPPYKWTVSSYKSLVNQINSLVNDKGNVLHLANLPSDNKDAYRRLLEKAGFKLALTKYFDGELVDQYVRYPLR